MPAPSITSSVSADFVSPGNTNQTVGNLTIGAGTVLVVAVLASDAGDAVDEAAGGLKVGGVALTQAFYASQGTVWYLDDLSGVGTGSKSCTVYFNAGGYRAAVTFYAVDRTGGLALIDTTNGSGHSDNTPTLYTLPNMSGSTTDAISFGFAHNNGFFSGGIVLGGDLVEDHSHDIASIRVKTFHDTTTPLGGHAYGNNATGGTMYMGMAMFGPPPDPDVTFTPDPFGVEVGFASGIVFSTGDDVDLFPLAFGVEVGFQSGIVFGAASSRQVMLVGGGIETPEMTEGGEEGQVLTYHDGTPPTWETPASGSLALDDLTDVNAPTPSNGDVLAWDSTPGEWVPVAPGTPTLDYGEAGDISASAPGDTAAAGATSEVADAGHRHAREAWGAAGDMTAEAFGDTASAGASGKVSDAAHRHAMPTNPVTAHEAAADPHTGYVLESLLDAKGDLIVASADNTPGRLPVGATTGHVLTVDPAQSLGVKWAAASGLTNPMTTQGDIIYSSDGSGTPARLARGGAGDRLTVYASIPAWVRDANGDNRPLTAHADDEEMDAALDGAWTWTTSSGTPTDQRLHDMLEANSAPTYNRDSDVPGALVMQPVAGGRILVYRTLPLTAGDVWTIVAKVRLLNAFAASDAISMVIAKETSPVTSSSTPTNGVTIRLRRSGTTAYGFGATSNGVTAAVAAAEFSSSSGVMYACFTSRANGDVLAWVSHDGIAWANVGRFNGGNMDPKTVYFITDDNSNSDSPVIGVVDWVRFGLGHNNPLLLMNGLSAVKLRRSLRPTGDGYTAGGAVTYSTGTTGYVLVDDPAVDSADYVQYRNASAELLYTFPSTGVSSGTIERVRFGWAGSMTAPTSAVSKILRVAGTDYTIATILQSASSPQIDDATTCPDGSGAWTWTKANAIEYGIKAAGSGPYANQTNMLWVEIVYTP